MEANVSASELATGSARLVQPGDFEPSRHFYPRALNAQLHPLIGYFLRLTPERLVSRYCHLNPMVDPKHLLEILQYRPRYFFWGGADLFHVTTEQGNRAMVVIETNSCPSGNKSMPIVSDDQELGGFRELAVRAIVPSFSRRGLPSGGLAMLFDKNKMEASGYAAAIAEVTGEPVWLAPMSATREQPAAEFDDSGVLHVTDAAGTRHPIRAAMRYVTQRPWTRIPVQTRTAVFNPVIACLAGGRNKLVAAKAYEFYNAELEGSGLAIGTPETIRDLRKEEIPLWVQRFGGMAVVKVPYANAGQGVFTITSERELEAFVKADLRYNRFIVQSLIGHHNWSSTHGGKKYYQVGTMPNKRNEIYVADLRMMVSTSPSGYRPLAIYARRARKPLESELPGTSSWDVLGTNLSNKRADGGWDSDTDRLMLMDRRDFNLLGVGLDDLIEGFIQTVLSVIAIDKLAGQLITKKGKLRRKLFVSLNEDQALIDEFV